VVTNSAVTVCSAVIVTQFDPFAPLYAELKFASHKKTFKKYFFEFNRTQLAYRKESKATTSLCLCVRLSVSHSVCLSVCLSVRLLVHDAASYKRPLLSGSVMVRKWFNDVAFHGKPISELRSIIGHMGSHSVTCHPTQVNALCLDASHPGWCSFTYPGGMEG